MLDLINTVDFRHGEAREETLRNANELIAWMRGAGLVDSRSAAKLAGWARSREKEAGALLAEIHDIRELAARLVEAVIDRVDPGARDLARLNELARECDERRIEWTGNRYSLALRSAGDCAVWIRHLIVGSVTGLLTSGDMRRVARCQDDRGCGWLFIDNSRAGNRRWCSMSDCGNRAKARSFARRGRRS
ncbi:MAG TPA: CGNR zinc finger domain-containing protein [Burkholderiales bacterium]|nr:CGNR zinc finger domain-containing protein [Burkholderiales bacterium]